MEQGIFAGIPAANYHGMTDAVSNSMLGRFDKCPAAVKVPTDDTGWGTIGRATHCYILEGLEAFEAQFVVAPECDKRTKAGKELYASISAASPGKEVTDAKTFEIIKGMASSVGSHPAAQKLLSEGKPEQSVFWKDADTGLWCKARPDWMSGDVVVDLKTTNDASHRSFARSCVSYGYARQAAFYCDGLHAVTGEMPSHFYFIVVEKVEPYRVECYELSPEFLSWGRKEYDRLLEAYSWCIYDDSCPPYQSQDVQEIPLPSYL